MAKKQAKKEKNDAQPAPAAPQAPQIPKEVQEKLDKIKKKLDTFTKKITEKFDKYIMGVSLLPPLRPEELAAIEKEEGKEAAEKAKEQINVLVLIDDADSKKMTKQELAERLTKIIDSIAGEIDKKLTPDAILLSELWQSCYDAKYDLLRTIAMSAPVFDRGMLQAIKIAEVHKQMVLKKFEKYIVTYVLGGSLVQGRATPESDIDVFIVIDDTDVKRMTRAELKDKLRAIIVGMGMEAGEITGIKNKINIQTYILTDFWDYMKEANPIIFTFLRDGVPFYDRGIFMPWKQLLKMGRVKPSMEAIDMHMSSGEQIIKRIELKLSDIGIEDLFYATLMPSQAALMMHGVPPTTPKETPEVMRDVFVKKEKLLEDSFIKILERVIQVRKDVEHGAKKKVSGKEIDELLDGARKYLERMKKLFETIEKRKEEEGILNLYETALSIIRDALRLEDIERVKDVEAEKLFDNALVATGKIPERYSRLLKNIFAAKKDYDNKKLTKPEITKTRKEAGEFIKYLLEHIQRTRGASMDRARIRVKYGKKYGEMMILEKNAFITLDMDTEQKEVQKAELKPDGALGKITKSNMEELDKELMKMQVPPKVFIKEKLFENLKKVFGPDVEVLVNY